MSVRRILNLLGAACFCLAGLPAHAAHTQARLILAADTARPGDTVLAGVQLRMDPRWHTYWRNPGASGMATKIEWQLPAGVTAGAIQWPVPEKLPDEDLTTYIYTNEVVLLVPLKLAADLRAGPLDLKAEVSWLECDVQCVPGGASVKATLNVGTETKPSKDAALLQAWQAKAAQERRRLVRARLVGNGRRRQLPSPDSGMELDRGSRPGRLLPGRQRGLRSAAGHRKSSGRAGQDPPAQGGQEAGGTIGRSKSPAC